MKKNIYLILFILFTSVKYSQTFQKYIKSVNPTYPGLYANGIGLDIATNSIFIQSDQHNNYESPSGLMKVDTCGNVLWTSFTQSQGSTWSAQGTYYNGGFTVMNRTNGSGQGGMATSILNFDGSGNLTSSNGVDASASSVIDYQLVSSRRMPNGDMLVTGYGPVYNNYKDIVFARLNQAGNLVWSKYNGDYDATWENGWGCDFDPVNSDCYFVGQNFSFSQTYSNDIHIIKTDINGTLLWAKNIATPASDIGWCVKVLPNQEIVIIGTTKNNAFSNEEITFVKLNPSGNIVTSCKYQGTGSQSIIINLNIMPNGNLLLSGYTNSFGQGGFDALLMEVDLTGNIIWQKAYGASGTSDDESFFNAVFFNNHIYSAGNRNFGNTNGTGLQVYLVKTTLNGSFTNPNCSYTNGNFVKVSETYTIFDAKNVTPSGFNFVDSFTSNVGSTTTSALCGNPTASFTPQSPICANQTISLTDQSTDSPLTWEWSSTANNISTPFLQNQSSVLFTTPGTYTIQLVVSNCVGSDTMRKVVVVNPYGNLNPTSNGPICSGANLSFSVTGTGTYTWSGPGSYSSNLQNPIISNAQVSNSGIYTVSVSNGGCISSGTVNAIISSMPNPSITAIGSNPLCSGNSINLNATGASNFTWTPGNLNNPTITVTPTVSTTYTLLSSNGSAACTNTAVYSVTVNPTPLISITGNSVICNGQSTTLTVNGANTYTWNTGATSSSINVTPTVTTNYSVVGVNPITSCSNTATYTVNANGLANLIITGNNNICDGQSTTLTATGVDSYTWNTGSVTSSINVTPTLTTTYSVAGTNTSTGCPGNATITVNVNPLPLINIQGNLSICNNQSTILTATGADSYSWNNSSITNSININPNSNTTYSVIGTNTLTSCSNTAITTVTVNTLPVIVINGNNNVCAGSQATLTVSGANTYTWNTGATSSSINVTPTVTTNYSVVGINSVTSCSNTTTYTVNVNSAPIITISGNNNICNGQSVSLIANGANSYTWNNGATVPNINSTPTITSTYSVTGTNTITGCSANATAIVTVNPLPVVSIQGNLSICTNQSTTLNAIGANSYTWNNSLISNSINVNPNSNTTYSVIGTNTLTGCSNTANATVTVNTLPVIVINGNNNICVGTQATLTANGANTYTWNTLQTQAAINTSPNLNTTYSVTGTNTLTGCSNSSTFVVNVTPSPVISIVGVSSICLGQSTILTATGATNYVWNDGSTSNTISVTPNVNSNYSVSATNNFGCIGVANYNVVVSPPPVVDVIGNTTICNGEKIFLSAVGATTYTWSNNLFNNYIELTPTNSGTISVTGYNSFGCFASKTVSLTVNPVPITNIQVDSTLLDCNYLYKLKGDHDTTVNSFYWVVNNEITSYADEITHSLGFNKTENFQFVIKNIYGCTNASNKTIHADNLFDNLVFVPNTFTPNNDALNDKWYILSSCLESAQCNIFDRWGHLIFTSNDLNDGWDGTFKGDVVKNDIYVYKLNGKFYNGNVYEKTGFINVLK